MKKEKISEALGKINTKYIEEAADYQGQGKASETSRQKKWLKWGNVAAVLIAVISCLLVVGIVAVAQGGLKKQPDTIVGDTRWPIKEVERENVEVEENTLVPEWKDMTICQQFPYVEHGNNAYSGRTVGLDAVHIGDVLETVVMTGRDQITDEVHTMNATLYTVKNFSKECVIAVQFEGQDDYYVYVNSGYRPETLGDFIEALHLRDIVSFGSVWYSFWSADKYTTVEFVDLEDSVVWEMLLDDTSVKNVYEDGWSGEHPTAMSISVEIPLLGYGNISLAVTEDGYLTTNILDTGKAFYIGVHKVQAFMEYVIENCKGYELVYKTPGEEEGEPESGGEPQPMPIISDDGQSGAEGKVTDAPEATPVVSTPMPSFATPSPSSMTVATPVCVMTPPPRAGAVAP